MNRKSYKARTITGAQKEVRRLLKWQESELVHTSRLEMDHLLLRAVIAGVARWEPFSGKTKVGEICVDGIRHVAEIHGYGTPKISVQIGNDLTRALAEERKR